MTRLAIIADDLSSATDCGAQVARSGQAVIVPLRGYRLPAQAQAAVISIDTDSRSLAPGEAYAAVKDAAAALAAAGWQHFYKSMDSTLRGNLGAEIDAVLDATGFECAIIAPAFPKYGRTTLDAVQRLNGRPLNETEFGSDPTAPVREANLIRLLSQQSRRQVGSVGLPQLRQGPAEAAAHLARSLEAGHALIVFDVEAQADLERVGATVAAAGRRIVWVGSTGLAEFVPPALGLKRANGSPAGTRPGDPRPALVLAGSASETTQQQLSHAQVSAGLQLVRLDPRPIVAGGALADGEIERVRRAVWASLRAGRDAGLAVQSTRGDIAAMQAYGAELGLAPAQVAQRIAGALAAVGAAAAAEAAVSGVVATGGDTAKALCEAVQAEALEILGEVEAGIPLMRVLGPRTVPLVTKAGGFGSAAAIVHSLARVKEYG